MFEGSNDQNVQHIAETALEELAKAAEVLARYAREANGLVRTSRLDFEDVAHVLRAYEQISNSSGRERLARMTAAAEETVRRRQKRQQKILCDARTAMGIDEEIAVAAMKGKP